MTEFEFQLHPVNMVLAGMLVHPAERAKHGPSSCARSIRPLPTSWRCSPV